MCQKFEHQPLRVVIQSSHIPLFKNAMFLRKLALCDGLFSMQLLALQCTLRVGIDFQTDSLVRSVTNLLPSDLGQPLGCKITTTSTHGNGVDKRHYRREKSSKSFAKRKSLLWNVKMLVSTMIV